MGCDVKTDNKKKCNCTREPCERKGNCCACVAHHKAKDQLPACFFTAEEEATYDRSVSHYLKCRAAKLSIN